ncbi:hypothetical protein AAEH83_07840, partial [Shewanella xiamenensis]
MRLAVLLNLLLGLVLNLFSVATAGPLSPAQTKPVIRVGGYQFAPYVNLQSDGRYTGLIPFRIKVQSPLPIPESTSLPRVLYN